MNNGYWLFIVVGRIEREGWRKKPPLSFLFDKYYLFLFSLISTMKPNISQRLVNNESMLTVRLPKALMLKVTKVAIRQKVTRSDLVRNILQNVVSSLDNK